LTTSLSRKVIFLTEEKSKKKKILLTKRETGKEKKEKGAIARMTHSCPFSMLQHNDTFMHHGPSHSSVFLPIFKMKIQAVLLLWPTRQTLRAQAQTVTPLEHCPRACWKMCASTTMVSLKFPLQDPLQAVATVATTNTTIIST